jgi:predicted RNA-binding protein with TRAM domain
LQAVKAGDSVNVTIEEINGDYTITSWQAAK